MGGFGYQDPGYYSQPPATGSYSEPPYEASLPEPEPTGQQYCTQCGTQLQPDARFCTSCGTPV